MIINLTQKFVLYFYPKVKWGTGINAFLLSKFYIWVLKLPLMSSDSSRIPIFWQIFCSQDLRQLLSCECTDITLEDIVLKAINYIRLSCFKSLSDWVWFAAIVIFECYLEWDCGASGGRSNFTEGVSADFVTCIKRSTSPSGKQLLIAGVQSASNKPRKSDIVAIGSSVNLVSSLGYDSLHIRSLGLFLASWETRMNLNPFDWLGDCS
jgi:hypothetical protein